MNNSSRFRPRWFLLAVITMLVLSRFVALELFADEQCFSFAKSLACPFVDAIECQDYNQNACNNPQNPVSDQKLYVDKWQCFPLDVWGLICVPQTEQDGSAKTAICWRRHRCQWIPFNGGSCVSTGQVVDFRRRPIYLTVDCILGLPIDW